jgi:hypothetical protein
LFAGLPATLLVCLAAITAVAAYAVVRGGDGTTLSEAQWQRVVQRMRLRATPIAAPSARQAADRPPAPAARPAPRGFSAGPSAPPDDEPAVPPGSEPHASGNADDSAPDKLTGASRLPVRPLDADQKARQAAEYAAARNKSILELQQFRDAVTIDIDDGRGRRGSATLLNLNPQINAWYLLRLRWQDELEARHYHLANALPQRQSLVLQEEFPRGIGVANTAGTTPCDLWSRDNPRNLTAAAARDTPYAMLCDERVVLRLQTTGHRTTIEKVTDFLRDSVWGGEAITVFVRQTFFQDAFLSTGALADAADPSAQQARDATAPRPARLSSLAEGKSLQGTDLGLSLAVAPASQLVGRWYPVRDNPGVFAGTMQPSLAATEILAGHTDRVVRLDEVEAEALAYLVAFDLARFDVAFATGTDHPRLGWSDRVPEERRVSDLDGPDGIASRDPLVATGIIPASLAPRSVAAFTGGFKRTHGGFRYGDLALVNNGSHYGFIEEGVVFSKLQPGLATIYVLDDGGFEMKTWSTEDDTLLERIRYARQNGVPIIERAAGGGPGVPGVMLGRYGAGNWSGSQDGNYRTVRAGACLQETESRRFLIYAYFSSATPSAMARVFQAYGCTYAMLLDMNALEHTYLAVYSLNGSELAVEHLVRGMEVLDKSAGDQLLPRFLGYADNRDFFYILRREPALTGTAEGDR